MKCGVGGIVACCLLMFVWGRSKLRSHERRDKVHLPTIFHYIKTKGSQRVL